MDRGDKLTLIQVIKQLKKKKSRSVVKNVWSCSSQSEGQTSLNDVSAVVGGKEGWTDRRLYLSLINLSHRVEKRRHLINKRDTAYAFPQRLSSVLSVESWGGSQILEPERRTCSRAGTHHDGFCGQSPVWSSLWWAEVTGTIKIFIPCKVFCLPGFPLKVDSCRLQGRN